MKTIVTVIALAIVFTNCQNQSTTKMSDEQKVKIADEITSIANSMFKVSSDKDVRRAYSRYSSNPTGIWEGDIITNWSEQKEHGIAFYNAQREINYSIQGLKVDVLSNDAAVLHGKYTLNAVGNDGKVINNVTNAWTWVLSREENEWKIVHFHISKASI